MEAFKIPVKDNEWRLQMKRPELDLQIIRLLNSFSNNRAGDSFRQNCMNVHKMFFDKFGRYGQLSTDEQNFLQRRADEWTALVEKTYSTMIEARINDEDFNTMSAMSALHKFLRQTESMLSLPY